MLRYLTSGESHGIGLMAIIEGLPSNLKIDIDFINNELSRRQSGYGRGDRMKIESDKIEILSGVRNSMTLGSPVTVSIKNKDYENWKDIIKTIDENDEKNERYVTRPRPGHADLPGGIKYNQKDLRNILERASARETAIRVAVGAICKLLLKQFNIDIYSYVTQIGNLKSNIKEYDINELKLADTSVIRALDKTLEKEMIKYIDNAKEKGDTLGGCFQIIAKNVPIGLGSHVSWDRKLDGKIAQAIMSLQAIKGVEIGLGFDAASKYGSKVHDEIFYDNNYYRKTNNAGGIEGGISNGCDITVNAAMKPIPSLVKPLNSVDMETKKPFEAIKERSDVCAVPAASIVCENILAFTLANEMIIKFGGDSLSEMLRNYNSYISYVKSR